MLGWALKNIRRHVLVLRCISSSQPLAKVCRAHNMMKRTINNKNGTSVVVEKFSTTIGLEIVNLARKLCSHKGEEINGYIIKFGFFL